MQCLLSLSFADDENKSPDIYIVNLLKHRVEMSDTSSVISFSSLENDYFEEDKREILGCYKYKESDNFLKKLYGREVSLLIINLSHLSQNNFLDLKRLSSSTLTCKESVETFVLLYWPLHLAPHRLYSYLHILHF